MINLNGILKERRLSALRAEIAYLDKKLAVLEAVATTYVCHNTAKHVEADLVDFFDPLLACVNTKIERILKEKCDLRIQLAKVECNQPN
jgi:hypothetical protein